MKTDGPAVLISYDPDSASGMAAGLNHLPVSPGFRRNTGYAAGSRNSKSALQDEAGTEQAAWNATRPDYKR
jgi:hypothetical protein